MINALAIRIKDNYAIYPMIICGDSQYVIDQMWKTSQTLAPISSDQVQRKVLTTIPLDPGGKYFESIPSFHFEVDGYRFNIQACKVETVRSKIEKAQERIPGYIRFHLYLFNYLVPTEMFYRLLNKLKELETTDQALHAELVFFDLCEEGETGHLAF